MRTRVLQRQSFGVDPAELTGRERGEYHLWNAYAAVDEISEISGEISWKPWKDGDKFNRDEYIGECVDALHFLGNLLVLAGCSDEELNRRYAEKQVENARRQRDGYGE